MSKCKYALMLIQLILNNQCIYLVLLHFLSAEPFIEAGFADVPQGTVLLTVEVGDRAL